QLQVQLPVEVPPLRISGDVRRHVHLAVKEALHNCLKHSGATWCRLRLQCSEERLHITVQDNGSGLPEASGRTAFSSGMRSMQQRMAYAGGNLHIHSGKDGTEIDFIIPLPETSIHRR
ncbi:MAG: histidine kinase, partial [Chitinophagaceae bacterium]